jgi:hypothetical protein
VLDGDTLASFEKDRTQLDAVLTAAPLSHVAQGQNNQPSSNNVAQAR